MRRVWYVGMSGLVALMAGVGCASIKPPAMYVEGLHVGKPHVTGVPVEVRFRVQNPNPDDLVVDKVEYQLILNGVRLGRGYVPDGFDLRGFGQEHVRSRFQLNLLSLPAGVREILEHDRVRARAKGKFYVRRNGGRQEIKFSSEADVRLTR